MKIFFNAFLASLVAISTVPPSCKAIVLSLDEGEGAARDSEALISFQTDSEVDDTAESLALFESAVIMSCNESLPQKKYHCNSASIKSASHSHGSKVTQIEETHLDKRGGKKKRAPAPTIAPVPPSPYPPPPYSDDDDTDDSITFCEGWCSIYDIVTGITESTDVTNQGVLLSENGMKLQDVVIASTTKWENTLCDLLGQTEAFAGACDCKIEIVHRSTGAEKYV